MIRLYQIINEVKLIVVHVFRHDQGTWTTTLIVQLLRVSERNQCVLLTMYEECGAGYISDVVNIAESVTYQVLEKCASLFFHYLSDALEGTH